MQSFLTDFQTAVGVKTVIKRPMKSQSYKTATLQHVGGFCCPGGHNSRWKKQKLANGLLLTSFLRHDVTQEIFQAFPADAQQFYNVGEKFAKTLK